MRSVLSTGRVVCSVALPFIEMVQTNGLVGRSQWRDDLKGFGGADTTLDTQGIDRHPRSTNVHFIFLGQIRQRFIALTHGRPLAINEVIKLVLLAIPGRGELHPATR